MDRINCENHIFMLDISTTIYKESNEFFRYIFFIKIVVVTSKLFIHDLILYFDEMFTRKN